MKKAIKAVLSLILCAAIAIGSVIFAFADADLTTCELHFGDDGHFRILQITDTHLHEDNAKESTRLIAMACDLEQPDLVMLTGDLASEDTIDQTTERVDQLMTVFETRSIPVAVTFGNHDSENGAYTREEVMALYNAYDCSISIDDGDELTGCGRGLADVSSIDLDGLDSRLTESKITVLCDVKNPLAAADSW